MNREDMRRDTKEIFGFVPGFLEAVPDPHIGPMWEAMKKTQFEDGDIPPKYQQLIMLAVSTYAKCKYCTDFHTEAAKTLGATQAEITEAALLTGHTAQWSNFLGGTQYNFDQFKREVRQACGKLAEVVKQKVSMGRPGQQKPSARA